MSLRGAFQNFVQQNHLFTKKDQLLIAVSGGVDSIVLCELCCRAGFNFSIAHCNFQLRGQESDGDEQFVKELAGKYAVPFFIKKFNTEEYATENKLSIQVAARELRYNWFTELVNESNNRLNKLLTAHHADDNIETIAMNFFKGSGINGLKGILPKSGNIIRPLLFATKDEILLFAKDSQLTFREDSSNNSDKYTRNYFRNQLLPAMQKVFPQVKENLLHNAERFKEINSIYNEALEKIKGKLIVNKGNEIHLPILKLQKINALYTILFEIIKEYGFTPSQLGDIVQLINAETGKYVVSNTHRIFKNRSWLIIHPLAENTSAHYLIEPGNESTSFPAGEMIVSFTNAPVEINKASNIAMLNANEIKFPLILRKWKKGDYFYPLGMRKKKKISRFLIDQKIPLHQKENTWVIESNKKIIWVVGHRIDERFKLTDFVSNILILRLVPGGQKD